MADSEDKLVEAILKDSSTDTDAQKQKKSILKNKFLNIGAQEDIDPKKLIWHMLIFHYSDVFFFINLDPIARIFIYIMLALVYFPFLVYKTQQGSQKISACTPFWILLGLTFLLPYTTVIPFLNRVQGLYMFLTTFSGIILIWFPPIPLFILFTENLGEWGHRTIVALIIFWIVCAFAGVGPLQNSKYFKDSFLSRIPTVGIYKGMTELPSKFRDGLGNIRQSFDKFEPSKWWDKQVRIATGDYYTGTVDENQDEPIGVFFEDIMASDKEYNIDDRVQIWSTLSAKTLDDTPLDIQTACRSKTHIGKIEPESLNIDSMEKDDILCSFPPGSFNASDENKIEVFAKFEFPTLGYLKTYFIDKERQRALQTQGIDPMDEYKITDKNPISVFTNGPIAIGMDTTTPLIGLYRSGDNNDFKLGMTLKNNWQGSIINITSFEIQVPDTMVVVLDSCDKAVIQGESDVELISREYNEGYVTYHVEPEALKQIEAFDDFETINCRIRVDDIEGTLGSTPIATKYFRIRVSYMYQLEDSIYIKVKDKDNEI